MQADLTVALALILASEGGFSDNPADPGGATMDGVTLKTLSAWRKTDCSIADLKALSVSERNDIYDKQYLTPIRFNDLPQGLDYAVADSAINSGPARAAMLLQGALGFTGNDIDGAIGAHTLAAVSAAPDPQALIIAYCDARLAFMQSLATWATFGNGWTNRVNMVKSSALSMSRNRATIADAPAPPAPAVPVKADPAASAQATGPTKITSTRSGQSALATFALALVTVGSVVTQASGALSQFGFMAYVMPICTFLSALGTLIIALQRARNGQTT